MELIKKVREAKEYINRIDNSEIDIAIILGTGLGSLGEEIKNKKVIKYTQIPHFPTSTVLGHSGELIIGDLMGKRILAMNGRFHYYEGYNMQNITFPIRVINDLGIKKLIVSNAAGGMNERFNQGDLMIITDHINLMGDNPLIGNNYEEFGPRFPDMSNAYNKELINLAKDCADNLNIKVKEGIYIAVSGPTYETPAELRMLRKIGGDAVGMSTIPEVIIANHMKMKILGISCITDMAIADNLEPLDHAKVVEIANKSKDKFVDLVKEIVFEMKSN
ncbi:purine-nucleoside phosphorylase [Clostridium rectalis]|uniref:purine-nucleoside phosphorylase n=1 Tax=Clostridium rectalis TaxID=2040295 RepID=UPI000F64112D|nr:purine-nucleoside phosphorylase [Clostridium rectalis]